MFINPRCACVRIRECVCVCVYPFFFYHVLCDWQQNSDTNRVHRYTGFIFLKGRFSCNLLRSKVMAWKAREQDNMQFSTRLTSTGSACSVYLEGTLLHAVYCCSSQCLTLHELLAGGHKQTHTNSSAHQLAVLPWCSLCEVYIPRASQPFTSSFCVCQ